MRTIAGAVSTRCRSTRTKPANRTISRRAETARQHSRRARPLPAETTHGAGRRATKTTSLWARSEASRCQPARLGRARAEATCRSVLRSAITGGLRLVVLLSGREEDQDQGPHPAETEPEERLCRLGPDQHAELDAGEVQHRRAESQQAQQGT